jgi:hypothetical protein
MFSPHALVMLGFLNFSYGCDRWERHEETKYYSKQVEIVFSAIYSSVNQLGAKASAVQGRDVTGHLVEIVSLFQSTCYFSTLGELICFRR